MEIGVSVLPDFNKDATDRNRTSPFAFTGNKFEFRMLGSQDSIACANIMINTAVSQVLGEFADQLEKAGDFQKDLQALILKTIREHKRIIFNGNGYDDSWVQEAEKRGLYNLRSTPDALDHLLDEKNLKAFKAQKIFSESEIRSRYEIQNENYSKIIHIEAMTMIDMTRKQILPAAATFARSLSETVSAVKAVCTDCDTSYEGGTLKTVSELTKAIYEAVGKLESDLDGIPLDIGKQGHFFHDVVLADMESLRTSVDALEAISPKDVWPLPSYGDLLFSVR